jgi:hypothetical protein
LSSKNTKKTHGTREQLIKDIQQVYTNFPDAIADRDFWRKHGKYADSAYKEYWSSFKAFAAEAAICPRARDNKEPSVAVVQDVPIADKLNFEREKLAAKKNDHKKLLDEALHKLSIAEQEREIFLSLKDRSPEVYTIQPKVSAGNSESVAVILATDWHIEERVLPGDVGGLNKFNLEIGDKRVTKFWQGSFRMFDILRRDTSIKTIVIFLGGDFISNTLHEDQAESNLLMPADAIFKAQNHIISGLKFMLENAPSDVSIHIVAHSGNHGRMTKKQRHTTETGNSLEQYMYYNLKEKFEGEPRLTWQIAEGYHSFLRLFDGKYTIRFHHGHAIRFSGGVGGMYIPVNKAINQWNKGTKVNLDCFGHYHTFIDANNFVANGSLIGYNAYALSIKADYEQPMQAFFLINKKYNSKTMVTPIFVDDSAK